jgi:hypothetical protein
MNLVAEKLTSSQYIRVSFDPRFEEEAGKKETVIEAECLKKFERCRNAKGYNPPRIMKYLCPDDGRE